MWNITFYCISEGHVEYYVYCISEGRVEYYPLLYFRRSCGILCFTVFQEVMRNINRLLYSGMYNMEIYCTRLYCIENPYWTRYRRVFNTIRTSTIHTTV